MQALQIAVQARLPVLLWGAPGVGKSSYVRSLGEALELPVEVVIASIREPSDFAGLPVVTDGEVKFAPPAWARRLAEAGRGILFLDEISTAPPAVQAALLRVVLDRTVGDLELPPDIAVVAAANPPDQAAGGWDLAPPLANRFVHLHWQVDAGRWAQGMLENWPRPRVLRLPEDWAAGLPGARALVAAFIKARPELLLRIPEDEEQAGRAWPSPRTWDYVAMCVAACEAAGVGEDPLAQLVAGCVGEPAALEFLRWRRDLDLPAPEDVLKRPDRFPLPGRPDQMQAILSACVSFALRDLRRWWKPAWQLIARVARDRAPDMAAWAARALAKARRQHPDLDLPVAELQALRPVLDAMKGVQAAEEEEVE